MIHESGSVSSSKRKELQQAVEKKKFLKAEWGGKMKFLAMDALF